MNTLIDLKPTQNEYYLTISECPLVCWENRFEQGYSAIRKYTETDENSNLIHPKTGKLIKGINYSPELDYEAWSVLYEQFISKVPQDVDFVQYMSHIKMLIDAQYDYIVSKTEKGVLEFRVRRHLNRIRLLKAHIESYEKTMVKGKTINQVLMDLSKEQGYQIRKSDLSVEDYFDLIEKYKKKN